MVLVSDGEGGGVAKQAVMSCCLQFTAATMLSYGWHTHHGPVGPFWKQDSTRTMVCTCYTYKPSREMRTIHCGQDKRIYCNIHGTTTNDDNKLNQNKEKKKKKNHTMNKWMVRTTVIQHRPTNKVVVVVYDKTNTAPAITTATATPTATASI